MIFPFAAAFTACDFSAEELEFSQTDGAATVNFTGYPYGMSTCVRVAKATLKK